MTVAPTGERRALSLPATGGAQAARGRQARRGRQAARGRRRPIGRLAPQSPATYDFPMKILFVCLGNICRSPRAEIVFREIAAREAPNLRIEIESAGTAAYHVG